MIRASVLPALPGFVLSRSILHDADTEWLLRGVIKNSSGFSDGYYAEVFVQPLYVPSDHVTLTYGHRLLDRQGRQGFWSPADPMAPAELLDAIQGQASPYLARLRTPSDLMKLARSRSRGRGAADPNRLRDIAYSAVLIDEDHTARKVHKELSVREQPPDTWMARVDAEVSSLLATWSEDPAAARRQLLAYRNHTAAALGLDER